MKGHLRYLKYVLIHKLYVARAGVAIRGWSPRFLWRLLIHDLSKFGRVEWGAYVRMFYGAPTSNAEAKRERQAAFDRAWLHHQHANDHHWQHWVLREDSGATKILLPHAICVDEMVADWLGAGTKILVWPTFETCVKETIAWYAQNREKILLREVSRHRVETILYGLADHFGLAGAALQMRAAEEARASITIPGR